MANDGPVHTVPSTDTGMACTSTSSRYTEACRNRSKYWRPLVGKKTGMGRVTRSNDRRWRMPGSPRQWSPWKWVTQTAVIDAGETPANRNCRWVPSPGSKSTPSPSQRRKYPLWFRCRVGAWLAVPSTTSSRMDMRHSGSLPRHRLPGRGLLANRLFANRLLDAALLDAALRRCPGPGWCLALAVGLGRRPRPAAGGTCRRRAVDTGLERSNQVDDVRRFRCLVGGRELAARALGFDEFVEATSIGVSVVGRSPRVAHRLDQLRRHLPRRPTG